MTNNDELALKLKAAAEKAGAEEWQVKRNGPGEYTVMVKGSLVKHSGWSTHRPVTDEVVDKKTADFIATASPATIIALLAERDADKKRIAELEESHKKLRETMAAIHNTISADGAYTPLAAIMSVAKRAYEESAAAAGIKLEVGE